MATLTITLESRCSGGEHVGIGLVLDGQAKRVVMLYGTELVSALSEDEIADALRAVLRLYARGKTRPQFFTGLQAGIAVAV